MTAMVENVKDNTFELYRKLSEVTSEVTGIACDQEAKFTRDGAKYFYASLLRVLMTVKPVLKKHGLVLYQPYEAKYDNGKTICTVHTIIADLSTGKFLSCSDAAEVAGNHDKGRFITYARRYGISAMLGAVADSDLDGDVVYGNATKKAAVTQASEIPSKVLRNALNNHTKLLTQRLKKDGLEVSTNDFGKFLRSKFDKDFNEMHQYCVKCASTDFEQFKKDITEFRVSATKPV